MYLKQLSDVLQYTYLHSQLLSALSSFFIFPKCNEFQIFSYLQECKLKGKTSMVEFTQTLV